RNANLFRAPEELAGAETSTPPKETQPPLWRVAIARLAELVREEAILQGLDPSDRQVAIGIAYHTTECRRRAAALLGFVERAYGFSAKGTAVGELGCGFGGFCLHSALEHGAGRIVAVDRTPKRAQALTTVTRELNLRVFEVVEGDLQTFSTYQ